MSRVSLIRGGSRRENVRRSLDSISSDIRKNLGSRQIVIKPNFVSTTRQLAATHVDQMRGLLDFFRSFHDKRVLIAEAACGDTMEAFRNFGFFGLLDEYDVEFLDLNGDRYEEVTIEDSIGRPLRVRVSSILLDSSNYRVSAAKLKTHDAVVVTLSVKNMAMGSVLFPDKQRVHQGARQTNLNIARLAGAVWPDLAVIDGMEGMEGNGPTAGNPVHVGVALSGTDALSLDRVACEVMGVDFFRVGYL